MENDEKVERPDEGTDEQKLVSRRDFLAGLRKWSVAVIGVAVVGGLLLPEEAQAGWVNGRGAWINGHGGGGASWVNRGGGGASWVNRRGW